MTYEEWLADHEAEVPLFAVGGPDPDRWADEYREWLSAVLDEELAEGAVAS